MSVKVYILHTRTSVGQFLFVIHTFIYADETTAKHDYHQLINSDGRPKRRRGHRQI